MSTSPTEYQSHHYPGPHKCVVFWDYENVNVPRGCSLGTVISVLKERIWEKIGPKQIPIQFKLYIRAEKLNRTIQEEMDINGVEHINIASRKPESVDKRMLVDIALHLYELEKYKKSHVIALISGDKDFGHLLSRIHKEPPVSHSLLILWKRNCVNPNLSNNVDFVINDFNDCSFKTCPNLHYCQKDNPHHEQCQFHHPANLLNSHSQHRRNQNQNHGPKHSRKRTYRSMQNNNNNNTYRVPPPPSKRARVDPKDIDSDSSIEILDQFPVSNPCKSDTITVRVQQHATQRMDMMKIDRNQTVKEIMCQISAKYNIPNQMDSEHEPIQVLYKGISLVEFKYLKLNEISRFAVSDGDTLTWIPNDHQDVHKENTNNKNEKKEEEDKQEPEKEQAEHVNGLNSNNNLNMSKPPALELDMSNEKHSAIDLT
eukprot:248081_1